MRKASPNASLEVSAHAPSVHPPAGLDPSTGALCAVHLPLHGLCHTARRSSNHRFHGSSAPRGRCEGVTVRVAGPGAGIETGRLLRHTAVFRITATPLSVARVFARRDRDGCGARKSIADRFEDMRIGTDDAQEPPQRSPLADRAPQLASGRPPAAALGITRPDDRDRAELWRRCCASLLSRLSAENGEASDRTRVLHAPLPLLSRASPELAKSSLPSAHGRPVHRLVRRRVSAEAPPWKIPSTDLRGPVQRGRVSSQPRWSLDGRAAVTGPPSLISCPSPRHHLLIRGRTTDTLRPLVWMWARTCATRASELFGVTPAGRERRWDAAAITPSIIT